MLRQPPQSFISTLKIEFEPFMHLKFGVIERSRNPKKSDTSLKLLSHDKKHWFFSVLFPLLMAEIVIARLFAPVTSQFIARSMRSKGRPLQRSTL